MLFGCLINLPCCYTRCVVVCCVSNGMKKYIHEAIKIYFLRFLLGEGFAFEQVLEEAEVANEIVL